MSAPDRSRTGVTASDLHAADLAAPFRDDAVAWSVVEASDAGDEVRVEPRLPTEAITERLDATLGVWGWSVRYGPMPGDAVACHLTIDGVTKGVVADPSVTGGGAETAAVAFALAAARFGVRGRWPAATSAWVPCDPRTLEPLHAPDPAHLEAVARRVPAEVRLEADLFAGVSAGVDPLADGAPAEYPPGERPATEPGATAVVAPVPKPEGQQMIDRLIDRLKDRGMGLQAARILVRHGGYGKDSQAARELYGELRQLLLDGPATDDDAAPPPEDGGPGAAARRSDRSEGAA